MAKIYGGSGRVIRIGKPIESMIYRICRIKAEQEMDWKRYLVAMLVFNCCGLIAVYMLQRLQLYLPLNPQNLPAPSAHLAFNTAASYASNSNWQSYGGETTLSYLSQMLALTTQNFLSAATGMALLVALSRAIVNYENPNLGNFWVDTVRGILYILLPLSFLFALILVSQGVIQNHKPNVRGNLLEPISTQITQQTIPMGPVASQVAIKQLGTNGGGFFKTNSAHPFENPTPLSNFLEMLAILLIPASLCYSFGVLIKDKRQGWALLAAMIIIFIPVLALDVLAEQAGNPALFALGADPNPSFNSYPAGNMEGKETRFGIVNSAMWSVATTAASNGSVNSMLDSYTALGGLLPLWMMQLGEVIFGGVGSGLYAMLMMVIITVFVAGLMVGRTPELFGKKLEPFEIKMASVALLIMPLSVLLSTSFSSVTRFGLSSVGNPGVHGFSEILYTFTSMATNNGSSFAGINTNRPFYNLLGGLLMLISRYWIAIPVIAIAGSLARKKIIPQSAGTLATHSPLFIFLLISVIVLVGSLSFLPSLALGPIVEHLIFWGQHGQ